jgi:hypothetical protein
MTLWVLKIQLFFLPEGWKIKNEKENGRKKNSTIYFRHNI